MNSEDRPWWTERAADEHRPPPARGQGARRGFGRTWWGGAWIEALEQRAGLNTGRLSRGRSYARRGAVSELSITAGVVLASVQGTRPLPYTVAVRVPALSAQRWEQLFDLIGSRLGHAAALLDGELPPQVAEDAAAVGIDLLPSAGEVGPDCSCPDWGEPCKHAAAVCYLVADALDDNPFALLRLRGRSRRDVLEALRARRTPSRRDEPDERPTAAVAGELAKQVYARSSASPPALPAPPLPPDRPGHPVPLPTAPPPESGLDSAELRALAADAVARAWQLCAADGGHDLDLSVDEDLARRAAAVVGTAALTPLAERAGLAPRELTGWALAWRYGGASGLRVLREPWTPDPVAMAAACTALAGYGEAVSEDAVSTGTVSTDAAAGRSTEVPATTADANTTTKAARAASEADAHRDHRPPDVRVEQNRATYGRWQLRLGPDELWYPFVRSFGEWDLAAPADPIADEALARAMAAGTPANPATDID